MSSLSKQLRSAEKMHTVRLCDRRLSSESKMKLTKMSPSLSKPVINPWLPAVIRKELFSSAERTSLLP